MNVEQFGKIQLVNADCMEVMRTQPFAFSTLQGLWVSTFPR